jgi:hypothetical protein
LTINGKNIDKMSVDFILHKTMMLFKDYLLSLTYYIELLIQNPFLIRYNDFLHEINPDFFRYYNNNNDNQQKFIIKHMNTIYNAKDMNSNDANYIIFCKKRVQSQKKSRTNIVYFD